MFWDVRKKNENSYEVFCKVREQEKVYGAYDTEAEAYEVAYVLNKETEVEGC